MKNPPLAVRRLDELVEAQTKHGKNEVQVSLSVAIARAENELTSALEDAGILEYRAILTGSSSDADAYSAALARLDAAYVELWARETIGMRIRVDSVNEERSIVLSEASSETKGKEVARSLAERMELWTRLDTLAYPTEASVHLYGISDSVMSSAPTTKDALRKRLGQVARVSEGPSTVKVLRAPKKGK